MTHDLVPPVPLTLGGHRVPLVGPARLYVCGVTPYDVTHLGHAATFVWVDALARVLRAAGTEVELTRNVTDVDDVLTEAARGSGTPPDRFAAVQQYRFDHDMTALGNRRPTHEPRAHAHVIGVQRLARALLDADAAYERDGTVWFRGAAVPGRAGLDPAEAARLCARFGEAPDAAKDDPFDVPVWRRSGPDDPAWPSPWGPGRPGWHAECAAMAVGTLGPAVDVHAGGADLAFPHHAYEAALAEAATGVQPFARAWMHVGTVFVDGAKMAKSAGNLVLVDDLLAAHRAAALRLLILDRPWAVSWEWDPAALADAETRLDALYGAAGRSGGGHDDEHDVLTALLTDLDVPRALSLAVERGGVAARTVVTTLGLG